MINNVFVNILHRSHIWCKPYCNYVTYLLDLLGIFGSFIGLITFGTIIDCATFAFIGGVIGYLGKIFIEYVVKKITAVQRFKIVSAPTSSASPSHQAPPYHQGGCWASKESQKTRMIV